MDLTLGHAPPNRLPTLCSTNTGREYQYWLASMCAPTWQTVMSVRSTLLRTPVGPGLHVFVPSQGTPLLTDEANNVSLSHSQQRSRVFVITCIDTRRLSVSLRYCRSQISGIHILQLYLICREHGCGASSLLATERNYDCATRSK